MLRRSKTLLAALVAASALVPVGAGPAHAMASCQIFSPGAHSEFGQIVTVVGFYKGPATAVEIELTCGIVYNGGTIARTTDKLTGPVAALADVIQVYQRGTLSACYEVTVTNLDGSKSSHGTCP